MKLHNRQAILYHTILSYSFKVKLDNSEPNLLHFDPLIEGNFRSNQESGREILGGLEDHHCR